jgi:hypothetical protein
MTDDKLYCIYIAPNTDLVRNTPCAGIPVDSILQVKTADRPDHGGMTWRHPGLTSVRNLTTIQPKT